MAIPPADGQSLCGGDVPRLGLAQRNRNVLDGRIDVGLNAAVDRQRIGVAAGIGDRVSLIGEGDAGRRYIAAEIDFISIGVRYKGDAEGSASGSELSHV